MPGLRLTVRFTIYMDLRHEHLKDHQFKTHTDTETVLRLYQHFGPKSVEMLNGMFAFAISWQG